MTGTQDATPQSAPVIRRCWLYLIVGVVIGFAIGYTVYATSSGGPTGNCINRDTSMFSSGVTMQQCQRACPTCRWQQS